MQRQPNVTRLHSQTKSNDKKSRLAWRDRPCRAIQLKGTWWKAKKLKGYSRQSTSKRKPLPIPLEKNSLKKQMARCKEFFSEGNMCGESNINRFWTFNSWLGRIQWLLIISFLSQQSSWFPPESWSKPKQWKYSHNTSLYRILWFLDERNAQRQLHLHRKNR